MSNIYLWLKFSPEACNDSSGHCDRDLKEALYADMYVIINGFDPKREKIGVISKGQFFMLKHFAYNFQKIWIFSNENQSTVHVVHIDTSI